MAPPALKGALVDKYAQIALYDAAENQRVMLETQKIEQAKKAAMRASLDAQIRMQQEVKMREKEESKEWLALEQARIKVWNAEEAKKIEAVKAKNLSIAKQREQQLRELAALRQREKQEMAVYEEGILRSIHKEIKAERAKEAAKRHSDAENLRQVAEQNVIHLQQLKVQKQKDVEAARALEAQWSGLLDKQERARARQLAQVYSRQARQYGAAESMQDMLNRIAQEDEARAERHAQELENAAAKRESDEKATRARAQQEMIHVLAIQVREKQARAAADAEREAIVAAREKDDTAKGDRAEAKKKQTIKEKNAQYAAELGEQMAVQEERRVLEPFLMSKAERQMNAAMLRRLPD